MSESTQPDVDPSSLESLRRFLATLRPTEIRALRGLLAAGELTAPSSEPTTIAHEGMPPAALPLPVNSIPVHDPAEIAKRDGGETLAQSEPVAEASSVLRPEVPGYEILDEIGRGGMAVVYRARQTRLNRLVALKMILSGSAAGERDLDRFRTEAETIAQFQHSHIVQVFEVGECTVSSGVTCPYMALEFCSGGSLAAVLNDKPWPAKEAASLIELLARTVHFAHQVGIIHRDLKPANILLVPRETSGAEGSERTPLIGWTPKISDFGLAKRLDNSVGRTQTGAVLGTPEYMAPEQAAGKPRAIGPPADGYALGVILYELLTGGPPFRSDTHLETLLQVIEKEPTPLRARNALVPRDLETICLKCLRKEPGRRYGSALELADDLRRYLDGEPIRARPPGLVEQGNRLLKSRPGLTLAYLIFGVAVLLFAKLYGLYLPSIFGLRGVSSSGFESVVLPMAALIMAMLMWADLRWVWAAGFVEALIAFPVWLFWPATRPEFDAEGLFLRSLAWGALAAILAGFLPRGRRSFLFLVLPALLLAGACSWFTEAGPAPFLAGVCHGVAVGLLARLVAWGLQRDWATCTLGAALGACIGVLIADRYGTTILGALRESGIRYRQLPILGIYLEGCLAFPGAIVCGLLFGKHTTDATRSGP